MDEIAKKKLYNEIERKTGVINTPTENDMGGYHTLVASGFIRNLWDEWKIDCQKRFNDVYWAKIWTDHLKAQSYDNLIGKAVKFVEEKNPEKEDRKEEVISLIGDGNR